MDRRRARFILFVVTPAVITGMIILANWLSVPEMSLAVLGILVSVLVLDEVAFRRRSRPEPPGFPFKVDVEPGLGPSAQVCRRCGSTIREGVGGVCPTCGIAVPTEAKP